MSLNLSPDPYRFSPMLRFKQWLHHLKVSHKISWGYVLALGSAVTGIILGVEIGDYYLWRAWQIEDHAQRETDLLYRLQTEVLKVQTHQQQLIVLINQPESFRQEKIELLEHADRVQQTLAEVHAFVAEEKHVGDEIHREIIPQFLNTYEAELNNYVQQLQVLVRQINPATLQSPSQATAAQALLTELAYSSSANRLFNNLEDDLFQLIELSSQDHRRAIAAYDAADILRLEIVAVSMLVSATIAVLLVLYTSRVIARPLRSVTEVAQRVTQESNFDLQAPVTTTDEVGVLATALNQLVQRVKRLLAAQIDANEQLESYTRLLEQKVQERTQALQDANDLLESYTRLLEQKVQERTQTLNEQNGRLQQTLQELQETQSQMIHSEKMSSLGQMMAGVAHEINNPVSFIYGNINHASQYVHDLLELLQLYRQQYPAPSPEIKAEIEAIDLDFLSADLPKLIESMQLGADRIREIVRSLRIFSRSDEIELKQVNLHDGIDSTLMILHHRLKTQPHRPAIEVIKDYGQLPLVKCASGQLNQVFMNILSNAIDALEENVSTPTIRIQTRTELENYVTIRIADNGAGIPETVQEHLFDPFFTTKPIDKGTGLGLSISYQIVVEKHHGQMRCHSAPGQGTEFEIQIPIEQPDAAG